MLDKLKIALVLFIIGTTSGLLIWGTNELTEERIAINEERMRLANYVEMFPNIDITNMPSRDPEISSPFITEIITIFDSNGNQLGEAFIGRGTHPSRGMIEVLIGVDNNQRITGVYVTETEHTQQYIRGLSLNYLPNFKGQDALDISYDVSTGATQSYNVIRSILENVKIFVGGDTVLEAYQELLPNADSYRNIYGFEDLAIKDEFIIYDAEEVVIGYAYHASINGFDVAMVVDPDDVFLGFVGIDHEELTSDFDVFNEAIDQHINDIDVTVSGDTQESLLAMITDLVSVLENKERVVSEYVVRVSEVFEDDVLVGYIYYGRSESYGGNNFIEVKVNLEGELEEVNVVKSGDTPDFLGFARDEFNVFIGETSLNKNDVLDAVSGATASGTSLFNVVNDALTVHAERNGE